MTYSQRQDDFFAAVERGDVQAVRAMIAETPRLLTAGAAFGASSLHLASAGGNLELMDLLVAAGQDVDLGKRKGMSQRRDHVTPLSSAADAGQVAAIAWLLDRGATPTRDPSVVGVAAASGNLDAVRLLVARGADPHATWADGRSNARTLARSNRQWTADALLASLGVELLARRPAFDALDPGGRAAVGAAHSDAQRVLGLAADAHPATTVAAIDSALADVTALAGRAGAEREVVLMMLGSALGEAVIAAAGWSWCRVDWGDGPNIGIASADRAWVMLPLWLVEARADTMDHHRDDSPWVGLGTLLAAIVAGALPPAQPGDGHLVQ